MAEVLGGVASVLTITESIAHVIRTILSCRAATNESRRLTQELSYVRSLLESLKETTGEQETWNHPMGSNVLSLDPNTGALHQFQQLVDLLELRIRGPIQSGKFTKFRSVLEWPYKQAEAQKLITAVERYKSLFELALENNHIRLSKATRQDVKDLSSIIQEVSDLVQNVLQEAKQSNQELQHMHKDMEESKNTWQKTSLDVDNLTRRTEDADFKDIFKRLTNWNFWVRQRDILSQRVGSTGEWFLSTSQFTEWKSIPGHWSICYGAPGVGKSVLASVIVDHLQESLSGTSRVIAFYFDRADASSRTYENFLGSLLQQLIYNRCSTWCAIRDTYQQLPLGAEPTSTDLITLIRNEVQGNERIYLILDALDEWSTDTAEILSIVSDIEKIGPNVNVFITSRPILQREQLFPGKLAMELHPPITDLEEYVSSRLETQSYCSIMKQDSAFQELVRRTILEKCDGLFLLARLQIDQLKDKASKKSLMKTLQQLPKTPEDLYDDIMKQIDTLSAEEADLAKKTFEWVSYAREPPHIYLIQYALAIELNDSIIDEDGIVDWDILTKLCGGLIVSDKEALTVRFVHPTTRSYFQTYFERQAGGRSETLLASTCLTFFLSRTFCDFMTGNMQSNRGVRSQPFNETDHNTLLGYSYMTCFLRYSAKHLISHYKSTEEDDRSINLMKALFGENILVANFWLVRKWYEVEQCAWYLPTVQDADRLCVACYLGLERIVILLLRSGLSSNEPDSTGQRPLYAAASRGETEVVRILLEYGAHPDLRSFEDPAVLKMDSNARSLCSTPLHCALRWGNLDLAQVLMDGGAVIDSQVNPMEKSANLRLAILSRNQKVVEFVLRQQQYNFWDVDGEDSTLNYAIWNGAVEVVELLLKFGALTTGAPNWEPLGAIGVAIRAPSCWVSDRDCAVICKLILDHGTREQHDSTVERLFRQYPLALFQKYDRTQTFMSLMVRVRSNNQNELEARFGSLWQCLCEDRFEDATAIVGDSSLETITETDFKQSNVLWFAVFRNWPGIVQSLLQLANKLHFDPKVKSEALCQAIEFGYKDLLPVILECNPPLDVVVDGQSPLCTAVLSHDREIIKLLLEAGASPNLVCSKFGSAMHTCCCDDEAPSAYTESVMSLLIDWGVDLNLVHEQQGTMLTVLAGISSEKSVSVVKFLLSHGADCNITGGAYFTPMIAAASSSGPQSLQVMQLLRNAGAGLDACSSTYGTALLATADSKSYLSSEKLLQLFEWGAEPTIPGPKGTLLELALKHPDPQLRNLVLEQSGNVDQEALSQALVETAASGGVDAVIHLIEMGANVNSEAEFLGTIATPLVAALITEDNDTIAKVELLVAYGAKLEVPTTVYANPLQMYLDRKIPEYSVVNLLLNNGIDPNAPSGIGTTTEIVIRHYKEDNEKHRETWVNIISLLYRKGAAFTDDDFNFLFQHTWFQELVTHIPVDNSDLYD